MLPDGAWQSHGIYSDEFRGMGKITVTHGTLTGWTGTGVRGRRVSVADSDFTGNQIGVSASNRAHVDTCTMTGNWRGLQASRKAEITDTTITDNGEAGVYGNAVLTNGLISNSQWSGYGGGKLVAVGSTIENSCLGPWPGCADVVAPRGRRPMLDGTSTCGTSLI